MLQGERTLRYLLSPLDAVRAMPGVTEIVFNQPGEFGVERNGTWQWHECPEFDFDRLDAIGILAGHLMAKDFDPQAPVCRTSLPDGERFTVLRPPVMAQGKISATIRIPSQYRPTVDDDDWESLTETINRPDDHKTQRDRRLLDLYHAKDWRAFFRLAVESRRTMLATGNTGSGKTTFLKRMMAAIPLDERLITIEDTGEFGDLPQRNRVALFYGAGGVTAESLVEASLRMRPDRIAMQELTGKEAFAYMRALLAGHPGGLTTLHAGRGADEAFDALATMVKQHDAGREIPDPELRRMIRRLIDIVVFCYKDEETNKYSTPYVWFRDAEEMSA
jgi:type IV secretion system protein VirB11